MKKQKRHFLILSAVCVLCAAAWFFIKGLGLSEDGEEEATEIVVTDFDAGEVTALSAQGAYPLDFVKEDGIWQDAQDADVSIQQSMVENLLSYISHITSDTAIEQAEELSQYGLEEPSMTIAVSLQGGGSVVIHIGESNSMTGEYYLKTDGDNTVYTVGASLVSAFEKTPEEFVQEETEEAEASEEAVEEIEETEAFEKKTKEAEEDAEQETADGDA